MKFFSFVFAMIASALCLAALAGGALAEDHFLAGPVPVQPDPLLNQNGGDFDMATADSGETVAFWGQSNGMWASVRPAGGTFGAPVLVSPNGSGTSLPEVAMTPDGAAAVVWRGQDGGFLSQVYVSVKPAGSSSFTAAQQVSTEAFAVPNTDPHVGIADNGTALVAWHGYNLNDDETSGRIRQRYVNTAGVPQGAPLTISPASPDGNQFPEVAVGPAGHALVTWVVGDSVTGDPATYWQGPANATPDLQVFNTNSGASIDGAVDSAGTAVIAYRNGASIIGDYRPTGAGNNFIFDQAIDGPGSSFAGPELAMDATGRATVVFEAFSAGKWHLQTVDRPAGNSSNFGPTTEDTVSPSANISNAQVAVGAGGGVILSWEREDERFYATSRDAAASTYAPQTGPISPVGLLSGVSVPVVDASGKGFVAFSNSTANLTPYSINAVPYDDVPVATGLSVPETAVQGEPVNFSVAPTDIWSAVTATEWTLDLNVTKSGNQVSHTYMSDGLRDVSVKLTDAMGNETTTISTIMITADKKPPVLSKFRILKRKAKAGRKNAFRFTLDDRAKVVISIKRISKGKGKRAQGRIVKSNVAAGSRKIGFRGKVGKKKLKPARYKATAVAIDQFGNRSKPKKAGFRILGR